METTSFNSPKNKFRASINFSKSLPEIGSGSLKTANSILELKAIVKHYEEMAKTSNVRCTVVIYENKKAYPNFNWVEIERYEA